MALGVEPVGGAATIEAARVASALAARLRADGVTAVRAGIAKGAAWAYGWEYRAVGAGHGFRLLIPGNRRPVAGVICVAAGDEAGEMAASVAELAFANATVLRGDEWKV